MWMCSRQKVGGQWKYTRTLEQLTPNCSSSTCSIVARTLSSRGACSPVKSLMECSLGWLKRAMRCSFFVSLRSVYLKSGTMRQSGHLKTTLSASDLPSMMLFTHWICASSRLRVSSSLFAQSSPVSNRMLASLTRYLFLSFSLMGQMNCTLTAEASSAVKRAQMSLTKMVCTLEKCRWLWSQSLGVRMAMASPSAPSTRPSRQRIFSVSLMASTSSHLNLSRFSIVDSLSQSNNKVLLNMQGRKRGGTSTATSKWVESMNILP